MSFRLRVALSFVLFVTFAIPGMAFNPPAASAVSPDIVISQVYGGGGNTGAPYTHDFVELFNRGASAVSITGWSVQYAGATGTTTWASTTLSGTVQPGQYYLIQQAAGGGGTTPLPTPDAAGSIAMGATAGKVALVNSAAALSGACPTGPGIVDFVGYGSTANCSEAGPTATLSNTTAALRAGNGCTDTDNNAADFTAAAPAPRNTASPLLPCTIPTDPTVAINEIDYDQAGTDAAEFIEIRNNASVPVNLSGYSLILINGSNLAAYDTIPLPAVTLAAGDYFVVCANAATVANCDLDDGPDTNFIQNGAPDAVGLLAGSDLIDAVSYEGDTAGYTEGSGVGLEDDPDVDNAGISRFPDGVDTDQNNVDFSFRCSTPGAANTASTTNCVPDAAPAVASTLPTDGATDVGIDGDITVTFSEAVTVGGSWFTIACTTSSTHTATVSGGPTTFTLNPDTDFVAAESCNVTILAAQVTDQDTQDPPDTMAADYSWSFSTAAANVCELPYTPAHAIQGSGSAAAITGAVTTQGVVVGDYEGPSPTLRGFYLQDLTGDGDPATSDGIFVFNGNNDNVALGEVVRVTGTAGEFQDQTQISSVTSIATCGTGTVTPVNVTLPFASADLAERYEGMLVRMPQTLYVTEHFQLGRFGQVVVSSDARLAQPTNVVAPGAQANALQAANNLNRIIIDDALQSQNPDPIVFGRGGDPLSASNTLRGGDTVTGVVGVMTYTWAGNGASGNAFRVRPINALGGGVPTFVPANPRPATPTPVGGTLQVAALNLLNYFNTFADNNPSTPGCFPSGNDSDCRGANSAAEFGRQTAKTVAAILGMNVDVLGVNEIENDGYGPNSAIADLVNRLNDATSPGTYAYVDFDTATGQTNALGTDAIKVGLIYKPGAVTPVGATAVLNSAAFVNGGDPAPRNRATFAQAFEQPNGARFIVSVNHLKSKGSACSAPDAGDGQGNCNLVRTNAANTLAAWLASDPTGTGDPDVIVLGDMNSYAKEDPITAIQNAGYTNLISTFLGEDAYSFVFDGQWGYLDHALASASLAGQVTGVTEWHINADEPGVLDYNVEFKSAGHVTSLYSPDQFRVSDHDPVIVGLDLNAPPTVGAGGPYSVDEGGSVGVSATGSDPDGDPLTYAWDLDNNGSFETAGQSATFSAAGLDGPSSHTIKVQATDPGGLTAVASATVNVANVAPTVGPISAPIAPVAVGVPVTASASFTDPGVPDTHTAAFDWGDGTVTPGSVTAGTASATHTYSLPGIYTITVTVTDDDGASGQAIFEFVVVYDPAAGFVTGGGWIDSPPGAYVPDPGVIGKATFGFVAKYKKGVNRPDGNTQFVFKAADIEFRSSTYEWLVVNQGAKSAQFKGDGAVNGVVGYKFMIWAGDGDPDTFRIRIWQEDEFGAETVLYDNGGTALGGGSIVIHK